MHQFLYFIRVRVGRTLKNRHTKEATHQKRKKKNTTPIAEAAESRPKHTTTQTLFHNSSFVRITPSGDVSTAHHHLVSFHFSKTTVTPKKTNPKSKLFAENILVFFFWSGSFWSDFCRLSFLVVLCPSSVLSMRWDRNWLVDGDDRKQANRETIGPYVGVFSMDEWVFVRFFLFFRSFFFRASAFIYTYCDEKMGPVSWERLGWNFFGDTSLYTNRRNVIPTGLLRGLIFGAEAARNFQVEDEFFSGRRSLEGLFFEQSYGEYIFTFFICVEKAIFINEIIALGLNSRIFVIILPKTW